MLPAHPIRVAWHVGYDNLVLNSRFEQDVKPKDIRDEFQLLDGAMFPAFLPRPSEGQTFVFADTLGFHAVGMVPDEDKEPKAAIAILARALADSSSVDNAPTVGRQSASVLGREIIRYLDCHDTSRLLHVHALRPGDGLTVARSLGHVQKHAQRLARSADDGDEEEDAGDPRPSFVLELYPSEEQRSVAGRFIAEAREKRRSGAGVLSDEDHWMLESSSLPGGISLPRLRWARKTSSIPKNAAHLAVAFDTFESRVVTEKSESMSASNPIFAYGLMSFFDRKYTSLPAPLWCSAAIVPTDGEKHPADRTHTDRLIRMQQAIELCVARNLNDTDGIPVLKTEISLEKADSLRELHRLCDWVITLDRNAGIEYFDSPRDNREIYDAYVIDCVPEREDLGCLQLITSTSNLDEVRSLLDDALDQMGLSRSRRNAEFLLDHLKELSGRLAIRLTGQKAPTSELIGLAMCHASCHEAVDSDKCWTSLRNGFFVPVDDIRDLLPPAVGSDENNSSDDNDGEPQQAVRPDLIYVTAVTRKGLAFRFSEVKYRRHLRSARNPQALQHVKRQVETLRNRWDEWYSGDEVCHSFRAVRRAKLARVLRFYADKARRHAAADGSFGLADEAYELLTSEINRLVEKGAEYSFAPSEGADRGWVFCPEYAGGQPLEITPDGWETRIFLFGPEEGFRRGQNGKLPFTAGGDPTASNDLTQEDGTSTTDASKDMESTEASVDTPRHRARSHIGFREIEAAD